MHTCDEMGGCISFYYVPAIGWVFRRDDKEDQQLNMDSCPACGEDWTIPSIEEDDDETT